MRGGPRRSRGESGVSGRGAGTRLLDIEPAAHGFRMPAEWERHRATWIAWPHHQRDWAGKLATIHWDYVEMVRQIHAGEAVAILVKDGRQRERAAGMLERGGVDLGRVSFHRVPTNRGWIRDSGPLFLVRAGRRARGVAGRRLATDWRFNAWAKYSSWRLDDRVAGRIAAARGVARVEPCLVQDGVRRRIVLEGGSIDVNGRGLLLTTEGCLLGRRQARNPGLSREAMEGVLAAYLGVRKVLWLGGGIAGDDTHGHVDTVARFIGPRTIAAAHEGNREDENFRPLRDNLARLRRMTDLRGRPLRIIRLPMPRPLFFEGCRLPASYLNFYIANAAVLVPTFNDPADRVALDRLQAEFRDRPVVGVHAVNLAVGQGTIHCLTQQEPE